MEARQLRLWRYCQWLMIAVVGVFCLLAYIQQIYPRMIGLTIAWLMCAFGLVLSKRALRYWSMNCTMLGASVAVVVACVTNGGLDNVASGWLVYLPLLAGVMGGVPMVRPWVISTASIFLILLALDLYGVTFPNLTRPDFQHAQNIVQLAMQGIAVVMTLLGLTGQVLLSESAMVRTIESLNREVLSRKEAERKAKEAEHKKTAFFTSMSHELRTPLNAIIGFTRLVIKQVASKSVDERGEDALQRVLSNGQDMLSLVNKLLVIAKSTQGEVALKQKTFDFHHLVRDVVADLSSLANDNVRINNTCNGQLIVATDMDAVRRIVVNLLGNALKYTERGQVTLTCLVNNEWVVLQVSDTGPGIAEEDFPYLFEPYTRGSSTAPGSGLGLALCQQWAKQLDGFIDVNGALSQGAEFLLYLPKSIIVEPELA